MVLAQPDMTETMKKWESTWKVNTVKIFSGIPVLRLKGVNDIGGITNIEYSPSIVNDFGDNLIYLYISRLTIEAANLEYFSIIVKDSLQQNLVSKQLEWDIPEIPSEHLTGEDYWWNIGLVSVPQSYNGVLYITIKDMVGGDNDIFEFSTIKNGNLQELLNTVNKANKTFYSIENTTPSYEEQSKPGFINPHTLSSEIKKENQLPTYQEIKISEENWQLYDIKVIKGYYILRLQGENDKWGITNISYNSYEPKSRSRNKGGTISLFTKRNSVETGNLDAFSIEVRDINKEIIQRKISFDWQLPRLPSGELPENKPYWWNIGVIGIKKNHGDTFYIYVYDLVNLNKPYIFLIGKDKSILENTRNYYINNTY